MEGQGGVVAKGVLCGEPQWQGGRTGAAGGPWAAQGHRARPRLWHRSGGRSWHLVNGNSIPLDSFCSLTTKREEFCKQ